MRFFTDENVSQYLARMTALFDRDNEIHPHCDHFSQGVPDDKWIPTVAGWDPKPVCIIGDNRILRTPALRVVARESGMSFVVLGDSFTNLPWTDQAWKFIKMWPALVRAVSEVRRPTIFDAKVSSLKVQSRHALEDLR